MRNWIRIAVSCIASIWFFLDLLSESTQELRILAQAWSLPNKDATVEREGHQLSSVDLKNTDTSSLWRWLPQRGNATRNRHLDEVPNSVKRRPTDTFDLTLCPLYEGQVRRQCRWAHDYLFCFSEIDSHVINIRLVKNKLLKILHVSIVPALW